VPPTASVARPPRRITRAEDAEAKVSPLELFFDLVFVFALTQVTAYMADDPTFEAMGRGMLILALVWWAWSGYTWLTSMVDPEQSLPRLVMFGAMGAMLILALATPRAFDDTGVIWGVAYIAVRLLHAALFLVAARGNPALVRNVLTLVASMVPGGGLILLGAVAFEGSTRTLLWLVAVVLDYGIVIVLSNAGEWRVHAEHFAERFGLVMIIAFGSRSSPSASGRRTSSSTSSRSPPPWSAWASSACCGGRTSTSRRCSPSGASARPWAASRP
jgi:low temperature requirement protein LtrA